MVDKLYSMNTSQDRNKPLINERNALLAANKNLYKAIEAGLNAQQTIERINKNTVAIESLNSRIQLNSAPVLPKKDLVRAVLLSDINAQYDTPGKSRSAYPPLYLIHHH